MSFPEGYMYKDGFYWTVAGVGPLAWDGTDFYLVGTTGAGGSEVDVAAGTWASRPTSGFVVGKRYYRRMTDIGVNGGTVMVRTSDMTEWGFPSLTCYSSQVGTLAAPVETLTVVGTTAFAAASRVNFPVGMMNAIKGMYVLGNVKHVGTGTSIFALCLGKNGTAADNAIRQTTAITAGNFWHIGNDAFPASATSYAVNSANVNSFAAANYDERNTQYDTTLEQWLSIGMSSATAGATAQILQLAVWVW